MDTKISLTSSVFPKASIEISDSTKNALKESVKCFGRMLYKFPYGAAITAVEAPSIGVEALFGVAGGAIGTLAGGIKILARKCMPRKVQKFLGLEQCKTLKEYAINGFHKGARLGELPGKLVGVTFAISLVTSTISVAPIIIPVMAAATVGASLIVSGTTFYDLARSKTTGPDEFSRDFIQDTRNDYRKMHKWLYGKDTPIKEAIKKEATKKESLKKPAV